VEVDGEAKLLAKDDERTSIDDERDIRNMKTARLLETVLTPLFFFLAMKNVLEWLLELLLVLVLVWFKLTLTPHPNMPNIFSPNKSISAQVTGQKS
jgi:hypothetical protein